MIILRLTMKTEQLNDFFPILQQGFRVTARVGVPLRQLLCEQFALGSDYVAERITTIFLDSRPVDDVAKAIIRNGSTVALSGAMPGLVGATMRRGGYYAAMRGGITHADNRGDGENRIGAVRIKLFNLLLGELGPGFLGRGVVIPAAEMVEFLGSRSAGFWQGCTEAFLNGSPVAPDALAGGEPFKGCETVRLTVTFRGEP